MFGLGGGELLIILVFALLFIGPKKLPELAKGLGKSLREFQKAKDDIMDGLSNPSVDHNDEKKVAHTKEHGPESSEAQTEPQKSEEVSTEQKDS